MQSAPVTAFILSFYIQVVHPQETTALILARGGSRGIPLKNLKEVGGISLLGRSILTAQKADLEVYVSTDHFLIALEGLRYGAKISARSSITASDTAPSVWGVQEFMNNHKSINIIVLIQATSPFLTSRSIKAAVDAINKYPKKDCVFSVVRSFHLRWETVDDLLIPKNFDPKSRPRRQDFKGELLEAGAFYVARRHLVEDGLLQNDKYIT